MKGIFNSWETADGKYIVSFNDDIYNIIIEKIPKDRIGSWNVLAARILGLSYAEYLRYARDVYGGKLYGKGHKYPIVKFDNKYDCNRLCMELSTHWAKL